jgi:hypothetical protein
MKVVQFFTTHDEVLARRRHDRAVPEILNPKTGEWSNYPEFDEIHEGREIEQSEAQRIAGAGVKVDA